MNEPNDAKLSRIQKYLLLLILKNTERDESLPENHYDRRALKAWGTRWATNGTRTWMATASRSLARLEARGLILRQNDVTGPHRSSNAEPPPKRTTHIIITEAGLTLAKRLTLKPVSMLTVSQ